MSHSANLRSTYDKKKIAEEENIEGEETINKINFQISKGLE